MAEALVVGQHIEPDPDSLFERLGTHDRHRDVTRVSPSRGRVSQAESVARSFDYFAGHFACQALHKPGFAPQR